MLTIGPISLDLPVVQAALSGYSDLAMRRVVRSTGRFGSWGQGAGMCANSRRHGIMVAFGRCRCGVVRPVNFAMRGLGDTTDDTRYHDPTRSADG